MNERVGTRAVEAGAGVVVVGRTRSFMIDRF